MLDVCQRGLFVGIDRHIKLPRSEWLTSASKDALLLRNFFRHADPKEPNSRWHAVVSNHRFHPKRIHLLRAISNFSRDVGPHEAGLLYFSGHATMSTSGLVLMSYDADEEFLEDTGVPLARILCILKAQSVQGKRFLVILDCCRDGVRQAEADDLPANVCVLYACSNGDAAYEFNMGGILARSIVESLEVIAAESKATICSVHALCKRLGRQLFAWRAASALAFELYGNWAERLHLPLAPGAATVRTSDKLAGPEVRLRYGFSRQDVFEASFATLALAIFDWYGVSQQSQPGKQFVRAHFDLGPPQPLHAISLQAELKMDFVSHNGNQPDSGNISGELDWNTPGEYYFFQIRIPEGCSRWSSSDFLVHILQAPVNDPQVLTLTWPGHVDFAVFKEFRHPVGGEWLGAASVAPTLKWTSRSASGDYRGLVCVTPLESGKTSVVITCETPDPYEASLIHLLPSLRDIFDLLTSIRI